MARRATTAEVLAVTEAGGREVTIEGLEQAMVMVLVSREAEREWAVDELPEWREGR